MDLIKAMADSFEQGHANPAPAANDGETVGRVDVENMIKSALDQIHAEIRNLTKAQAQPAPAQGREDNPPEESGSTNEEE